MNVHRLGLIFAAVTLQQLLIPCFAAIETSNGDEEAEENVIPRHVPVSRIFNPDPESPAQEEHCESRSPDVCPVLNKHRALLDDAFRWPNGIVYYKFDTSITPEIKQTVAKAMKDYHMQTCIRFIPRNEQKDYVVIRRGEKEHSCYSYIGKWGGEQYLTLGDSCGLRKGTVLHELMHTLGFEHEQSRLDRDKYVHIQWENIDKEHVHNFNIQNGSCRTLPSKTLSLDYSFSSIMHYSEYGFSTNGKKTIVPRSHINTRWVQIGQRRGLDQVDINRIREHYECVGKHSTAEAVGYECKSSSKGTSRHDEVVAYNGFLFKCQGESYRYAQYVPYGCLSDTNQYILNDETFIEGNYEYVCKVAENDIFRHCHACIPTPGETVRLGQTWSDGKLVYQCSLTSSGKCTYNAIGCADEKGQLIKPGDKYKILGKQRKCYENHNGIGFKEVSGSAIGGFLQFISQKRKS